MEEVPRTRIIAKRAAMALLAGGVLLLGILPFGAVSESPASAWLSERLIARAWARTLNGEAEAHPWPWMDSVPVAHLAVPGRDKDFVVMRGASGAVLAFAPGWHEGTQMPGTPGISLISAHRDREFGFLRAMKSGERLVLTGRDGVRHSYIVIDTAIVHDPEIRVPADGERGTLLLSTSYPSSNWKQGGDIRFVVVAREEQINAPAPDGAMRTALQTADGLRRWPETVNN